MKGAALKNSIEMKSVKKIFKTSYGMVEALKGVDMTASAEDFYIILGKSGCGKSTLLNIMGFMDEMTAGEYYFDGVNTAEMSSSQKANLRGEKIGFVFQSYNLIHSMTAVENIELPLGYRGMDKKSRREKALHLLETMGIANRAYHLPTGMSGGEQQRVAIARAIAGDPLVILADEPTGNLDEKSASEIMELLKKLHENGTCVIMVTHDKDMLQYATRHITMSGGLIVETAECRESS